MRTWTGINAYDIIIIVSIFIDNSGRDDWNNKFTIIDYDWWLFIIHIIIIIIMNYYHLCYYFAVVIIIICVDNKRYY